ncbi:MAG: hypothetical protein JSU68_02760, partial [Phycisphaerales bacterium]
MCEAKSHSWCRRGVCVAALAALILVSISQTAEARNPYRRAFFQAYPQAKNTVLDDVPSHSGHCGVCHFDFGGGGTRNPYGLAVEATDRSSAAIAGLGGLDSDGDGFTNDTEILDTANFGNTPTFPGLKPAILSSVSNVDTADIQGHLVPSTGSDTTPPAVTLIAPDGGQTLTANQPTTVEWIAGDTSGIAAIDLYISLDDGATFKPVALSLSNTGTYTWFPANRPTTLAIFRVEATDNAFNTAHDDSNAVFTIESPPGGLAPTTLRDFDQPGSQPHEAGILNPPEACSPCHGGYNVNVEPYFNWQGSMMANASKDLLMEANLAIANQDAPDSGDLCLRCHLPRGWLQGRSVPTDGSAMLDTDFSGVACDYCHRLVDILYDPAANPSQDQAILDALSFPGSVFGNGMGVIDPTGARRGPFLNADTGHPVLVSPFHREAALCGTCHNVSNPAFQKDAQGNYVPNAFDATATDFHAQTLAPVERTYSEWFYSDYNTLQGVYAPQFGGNKDYVATCQDCHMRDVTGQGCNFGNPPTRTDLPLHDMTGGSTWYPGLLSTLSYPGTVNEAALQAGINRARYMLQHAATLEAAQVGSTLEVTVTNETGHKLPTGYPEGRRMWINVKFYDNSMNLVSESAAYDGTTGELGHDAEVKIYEIKPGLDETTAALVGVDPGPSFHFVLNNTVYKDNRIPPRGFTNAAYAAFGGAHVDYSYPDGQYWDVTPYNIPAGATSAEVTLYYQSTSKEFIEFLRDENTTNTKGQELYDLWNNNDKCPPEMMAQVQVAVIVDSDGDNVPDNEDNCPDVPNPGQEDADGDQVGDACDGCPNDPDKIDPGICGCGVPDTDTDGDQTPDCNDLCPNDPDKIDPGICGCGVPDTDTDGDQTPDCNDLCPNDPDKTDPGVCGCGTPDDDTDGDQTPDCNDLCPNDPDKTDPGICGCGTPDDDTDGDQTPDCNDLCPNDPDKTDPGICGCGTPDDDTDGDQTPD